MLKVSFVKCVICIFSFATLKIIAGHYSVARTWPSKIFALCECYLSDLWPPLQPPLRSPAACVCLTASVALPCVFIIVTMTVCPGPHEPAAVAQEERLIWVITRENLSFKKTL